jgi:hypothetical protein
MGIGLAIVISTAIISVFGCGTAIAIAGMKYGDKYTKNKDSK